MAFSRIPFRATGSADLTSKGADRWYSQSSGGYTDIAAGSYDCFHAFWTDTNNQQTIDWFVGFEWALGTKVNQQDVVVQSDSF